MRIWLITIGEPLPTDGPDTRLLRTGILAEILAGRGHEVVWWSSAFDHVRKQHRSHSESDVVAEGGYRLKIMDSPGYSRNVSLRRIWDHVLLARRLRVLARDEPVPDVILCSAPTIELCAVATRYGVERGVPVAIDVRDLWPDIFMEVLPAGLRPFARPAFGVYARVLRSALRRATGITGITEEIVQWGLDKAGRSRGPWDQAFPMGYQRDSPEAERMETARRHWQEAGLGPDQFIASFFGYMGRQFRLEVVIEAARRLQAEAPEMRFVLCGDGEARPALEKLAAGCSNVLFPGWIGRSDIASLMEQSSLGLAPYVDTLSFNLSFPNKLIEYLSAGLPVVSSVNGAMGRLLRANDCGITYSGADELVSALLGLYRDPERRRRMSANAKDLYEREFVAETVYGRMAEYLESLPGAQGTRLTCGA